jgi:hypothetical protein
MAISQSTYDVYDGASPLLPPDHELVSRRRFSEWWRSAASAFLDRNAGLLLVATAQFFFAASNVCVKWLNGLDEQVPILEVRGNSEGDKSLN